MSVNRTIITAPAITSWASLPSGIAASSSAVAVTSAFINGVIDHQIQVTIAGPSTMVASPTTQVSVYIYASVDGSTWPGSSTTNEATIGIDAPVTLPANGNSATALGVIPLTLTTIGVSNIYKSKVFSVLSALGYLPAKYALMIVQNSGAALAATGHSVVIVGIYNA